MFKTKNFYDKEKPLWDFTELVILEFIPQKPSGIAKSLKKPAGVF